MRTFILITFLLGTAFASSVLKVTKSPDESVSASPYKNTFDESENYEEETMLSNKINPLLFKGLNFNYEPKSTAANNGPLSIEHEKYGENKEFLIQVEETSDMNESNPSQASFKEDDEIRQPTNVLPQETKQEANETSKPQIEHNLEKDLPKPPKLPEFDLVEFVKNQKLSEIPSTTPHYDRLQSMESYSWNKPPTELNLEKDLRKPPKLPEFDLVEFVKNQKLSEIPSETPHYDRPQFTETYSWNKPPIEHNLEKDVRKHPKLPELDLVELVKNQKLSKIPSETPHYDRPQSPETYSWNKPPIEHNLEKDVRKPPKLPEFDLVEFVKNQKLSEIPSETPHYDRPQSPETYLWTPETPKPKTFRGFPDYDSKPQIPSSFSWPPQDVNENKGKLLHVPPPPTLAPLDNRFLLQKLGEAPTLKENDLQLPESTHPETYQPPTFKHTSEKLQLLFPKEKLLEPKYKPEFVYPPQPELPQPSLPIKRTELYPDWQIPELARPSLQLAIDSSSWPDHKPELPPQTLPEIKPELPHQRPPYRSEFVRCNSEPNPLHPTYDFEQLQTHPNYNNLYNPTIQATPEPKLPPFKFPKPAYTTEIPPLESYEKQSQVYKNIPPSPTLPPFKWGRIPDFEIVSSTENPKLSTPQYYPPYTPPTPETTTTPEIKLPTITILPTVTEVPNISLPPPSQPPAEISPHKENNPHHHHDNHQEHNPERCKYVLFLKKKCPKY